MSLRTPFLLASTSHHGCVAPDVEASLTGSKGQGASCNFEVVVVAPPGFEVRGWQSAADAPEDLPEGIRSRSLCLLASLDGQFVGVQVEERSSGSEGQRVLQVGVLEKCLLALPYS